MPEQSSGLDLEQRLRALELEITDLQMGRRRSAPAAARPSRARRILVSLSVVLAIGLLPMVAFASDTFTDVPDSNQFHDAINNLYNARITRGCTTTPPLMYCPQGPVNRQQMAGFLSRGLGRATSAQDSTSVTADNNNVEVVSVTIEPGGLTGGTGFVLVTGSVSAYTSDAATCPCELGVRVRDVTGATNPSLWQFFDVSNTVNPDGFRTGSGTISWVFQVPSGEARTFAVWTEVSMTDGNGSLSLQGHITALYVPFGGTGGSTLGTFGTQAAATDGQAD